MEEYIREPRPDTLVFICENMYQMYKHLEMSIFLTHTVHPAVNPFIFINPQLSFECLNEVIATQFENLAQVMKRSGHPASDDGGSALAADLFKKDYLPLIPALQEEFTMPERLKTVVPAVASGDARSILLYGPAGTGKTIGSKLILQALQMPLMAVINCSENLDEFVLGKYLPEGTQISFRESYVSKAIREGGAVVFEEINFSRPEYLAFLNSLLDDNGFVRLDNGEMLRRHPLFRFFATMNMGYFGTKKLNQALYNRFNLVVELDDLSDAIIRKMLIARVPECEANVDNMLSVYRKIRKMIEDDELAYVVSARDLENWARQAKHEHMVNAAEKTIIQIGREDQECRAAIKELIHLYKWV